MPSFVKEAMLKEIKEQFEGNPYAFFSSYEGIAVADISEFRRNIEKISKRSVMVKHTLAKKALEGRALNGVEKILKGSVVVTFTDKDPQLVSKVIMEYAKTHEKWIPQGVIFEGKVYDKEFVKALARLPSRKELLTQVVVRAKSPISGFVMTLGQIMRGFAAALNEIKKQKEGAVQTA